jgi:type II secretory pathway component PulJ
MRRLREQRGYTAFELLFASTLFIALLVTTLKPLDSFWGINADNERESETQDVTRRTIDRLATELRSAGGQAVAIDKAGPSDVVFGWVDPNPAAAPTVGGNETGVKRVRYCLSGTTLIRQERSWTTAAAPALTSTLCPEPTPWSASETVATDVTNGATPLFTYNAVPCGNAAAPALDQIEFVGLCLKIERPIKAGERARPVQLSTVVALRNEVDGQ